MLHLENFEAKSQCAKGARIFCSAVMFPWQSSVQDVQDEEEFQEGRRASKGGLLPTPTSLQSLLNKILPSLFPLPSSERTRIWRGF